PTDLRGASAVQESPVKIVSQFPLQVREISTEWITVSDGVRLAARIWLPEGADRTPVIAWITKQRWCDGAVGVWGISWVASTRFRSPHGDHPRSGTARPQSSARRSRSTMRMR